MTTEAWARYYQGIMFRRNCIWLAVAAVWVAALLEVSVAAPAQAGIFGRCPKMPGDQAFARAAAPRDLHERMVETDQGSADSPSRQIEQVIVRLTNEARAARGARALREAGDLRVAARFHSRAMFARDQLSHNGPGGVTPGQRIAIWSRDRVGLWGENVAALAGGRYRKSESARVIEAVGRQLFEQWRNSPGHWKNILKPDWTHLGVGVVWRGVCVSATQKFFHHQAGLAGALDFRIAADQVSRLRLASKGRGARVRFHGLGAHNGKRAGPISLGDRGLKLPRGFWQGHFYLPAGERRWSIVPGPIWEIR